MPLVPVLLGVVALTLFGLVLGFDRDLAVFALLGLGATLFFMLTGRPPFRGGHLEVVRQHLKRPVPDPRVLVPHLSKGCSDLVHGLMEKKPEGRPASMEEVLTEIDRARSASDAGRVAPSPQSEPSRLSSSPRRRQG